jgi:hypothetical protein
VATIGPSEGRAATVTVRFVVTVVELSFTKNVTRYEPGLTPKQEALKM